jgi:hypothetical protein
MELEGVVSNRDGIGARVFVEADGVIQLRENGGGFRRYAQDQMLLHFGLAEYTRAERVKVEWPSGIKQEIINIPANQILRVVEPSFPSPLGKPEFSPGQSLGVYLWKDTFDGPYHLRASGNGPLSIFKVNILADQPFSSVVPWRLEGNDNLSWTDNYLSFTSRLYTGEDGIDFVLPPGVEALIAVELDGRPNPRQLHVGNSGQPIAPTGWVSDVDQLPAIPNFQPGEDLGLFVGTGSVPGEILARWNGDGPPPTHSAALKVVSSKGFQDVQTVSFEPCCDELMVDDWCVRAFATMNSWWDGLNIQLPADSTIGFTYHQDGLFQSHRVNGTTRDLGQANAYALPLPDIVGDPIYDSEQDKGLFVWRSESGVWKLRVTAGGNYGRYEGAIFSSLPVVSADGVGVESNDVVDISADQTRIDFTLQVWKHYQDGIDIVIPEGSEVSLELNGNTAEAASLVQVGGDRWPLESLPVALAK